MAFEEPTLFSASRSGERAARHARTAPTTRCCRRCGSRRPTSSTTCRGVWTPGSASRACRCPAVSGSGWRWPAPCGPARRCWCSTTRCPRWTSTPRRRSSGRCGRCWPAPRRWSSRTGASTVQLADRVALLVDGRIAAVGTHSELLADDPGVPGPAGQQGGPPGIPGQPRFATRQAGPQSPVAPEAGNTHDRPTRRCGDDRPNDSADPARAGSRRRLARGRRRGHRGHLDAPSASSCRPGHGGCWLADPAAPRSGPAGGVRRGAVSELAYLVGPLVVAYGIDTAVPALVAGRRRAAGLRHARLPGRGHRQRRWARRVFVRLAAKVAQAVLLDLRGRVFTHSQALSLSFHEKYTSGRVISRLTSDLDALGDLAAGGPGGADLRPAVGRRDQRHAAGARPASSGLIALAAFIPILLATRWFQRRSRQIYRRTRSAIASVIVQFTETMNGLRAVLSFRREARNRDDLRRRSTTTTRRPTATAWSRWPSTPRLVRLFGNLSLVATMVVGAVQVIDGTWRSAC